MLYDDNVELVKPLSDTLTDDRKERILAAAYPRGGNGDAKALNTAIDVLGDSAATKKLVVYLTDGEFCSDRGSVTRPIAVIAT